jgi:hypothetical protein
MIPKNRLSSGTALFYILMPAAAVRFPFGVDADRGTIEAGSGRRQNVLMPVTVQGFPGFPSEHRGSPSTIPCQLRNGSAR